MLSTTKSLRSCVGPVGGALFGLRICRLSPSRLYVRSASDHDTEKIRNIGIMAHIDAGKTTTTERMLYYSGFSKHLGNVDTGDTVMDYMEQERDRGITITSAAITFPWNHYRINLIDTPGHVDFTVEVERSLRVLDAAVTILDASAGVEAQTMTVWHQADHYEIPRLVYLNKMDKRGASIDLCLKSLKHKLKAKPLLLHMPLGVEQNFHGVVDLIEMKTFMWDVNTCLDGSSFQQIALSREDQIYEDALSERSNLIGQLADYDEAVAELVLGDVDVKDIPASILHSAVRKCTLERQLIPVVCGSSLKNKGVQPLLDSILRYLPSPTDVKYGFAKYYSNNLCALAFKVIHDKQRGPLTFLRIYSGIIKSGDTVYNINQNKTEKTTRLLQVYADEFKDMQSVSTGNIVLVAGMKQTYTGDTITHSQKTANAATRAFRSHHRKHKTTVGDTDEEEEEDLPVLAGLSVPEPVFFCSIEPPSLAVQRELEHALQCLQKEDPSLRVHTDAETGQTILSGMGELHLEIVKSRILREYRIDADIGPLQIAYRETITSSSKVEEVLDRTLGDRKHHVTMTLSVEPDMNVQELKHVTLMSSKDYRVEPKWRELRAVENGVLSALRSGPLLNFPMVHIKVGLHNLQIGPGTSLTMVSACASQCITRAVRDAQSVLLEPVMNLQITTDEDHLHSVLADLSKRRSHIQNVLPRQDVRVVDTITPLAELMGYSTDIRTITSGTATVSIELSHYQIMSQQEQNEAVQRVTGFLPS